MRRLLLLLLSAVLLTAGTACSSKETLSFSLFSTSDLRRDVSGSAELAEKIERWYRYAEEFMGMDIVIDQQVLPTDRIAQRCNEYVLQNDLADVFVLVEPSDSRYNLQELAKQGKILNLMDYKEYMPNYSKMLEENLNYERVNIDGGVYGFAASIYNPSYLSQYSWLYNYTAFQENGLAIPQNLEELYSAAKTLKEMYPDSSPIMFDSTDLLYICNVFGRLNRLHLLVNYDGDAYTLGLFEKPREWKNTIIYLNRLYREGLLDPGFDTYSAEQLEFNATNNKTFIIPNSWSGRARELSVSGGSEWVCGNTPNGLGGQEPYYEADLSGNTLSENWNLCISSQAENPELLIRLIDNEYAPSTMDLYNWGEEGVLYETDEEGQKHLLAETGEEYSRLKSENPPMAALWWNQDRGSEMAEDALLDPVSTVFNDVYEKMDFWSFSQKYIREENVLPDSTAVAKTASSSLSLEQSAYVSSTLRPIQNFILENIRQFIIGEKPLDEWDDFVEQAKLKGDYQSVLEIYNNQLH